ncbi:MAG: VWA domain-containing protein, partial [Actinomycetes bacterium]
LNPMEADTDSNGVKDGLEDSDGDGISNIDEQKVYRTDPGNRDTDNDGISDGDEVSGSKPNGGRAVTSPLYSRDPMIPRCMVMNGTSVVTVPEPRKWRADTGLRQQDLAGLDRWAVGCFVRVPSVQSGALIQRTTLTGQTNFVLSLSNNVPSISFSTAAGVVVSVAATEPLPTNTWVSLLGHWQPDLDRLTLWVNDIAVAGASVSASCASGNGLTTLGAIGLSGQMDDVYIGDDLPGGGSVVIAPDFVLMLDNSGSMGGQAIEDLRAAASGAVNAMPDGVRMAIITYNGTATLAQDFTDNKAALQTIIAGMTADDGTDFDPPLQMLLSIAAARTDQTRPVVGLFLSDGGASFTPAVLQQVAAAGIVVHTIALGAFADMTTLQQIATGTAGTLYTAISAQDLKAIFGGLIVAVAEETAAKVRFYVFDDGDQPGNLVEDFYNRLDWNYALRGVTVTNGAVLPETVFNWPLIENENVIPAYWLDMHFHDAKDPIDPMEDPDGDGLVTLDEYLLGYNPNRRDTDGNA